MKKPREKIRLGLIFWRRSPIWRRLNSALTFLLAVGLIFPALGFAFDGSAFCSGNGLERVAASHVLQSVASNILPDWGRVTSSHQGNAGRMVVFVHDLHCHYEVQSHISKILKRLARCHDLRLVGVEGDSRPVDVDKLATLPIGRVNTDVAEYFLKRGYITGAEYAAITSKYSLGLQGVESPELYAAEKSALDLFLNYASQGLCEDLRYAFQKLKPFIYSLDLAKLDHMRENFEYQRISLKQYRNFLLGETRCRGLVLAPPAGRTRSGWQKEIPSSLRAPDAEEVRVKLQGLERALREALYLSPQQRELDNCFYLLTIMEKMIAISAVPEEVAYFRSQEYPVKTLLAFLEKWSYAYGLSLDLDPGVWKLDQYLNSAGDFYSLADSRSRAFVQNLLKIMEKKNQQLAVLVAGGFHAALVEKALKRHHTSFISVRPRLTRPEAANPYFALLRGRRTPLEKLLQEKAQYFKTSSLFNDFTAQRFMDVVSEINILNFHINQGETGKETLKEHFQKTLSCWQENDESVEINVDSAWTDPERGIYAFKVEDRLNGDCFWTILRPAGSSPTYPCVDSQALEGDEKFFDVVKGDVFTDERTLARMLGQSRRSPVEKQGLGRLAGTATEKNIEAPFFVVASQLYARYFVDQAIDGLLRRPAMSRFFKCRSLAAYRAAAREAGEKLQRPPPGYYVWNIFISAGLSRFLGPWFYPAALVRKGYINESYGWIFTIMYLSLILALLSPAVTTLWILAAAVFMTGMAALNFYAIRKANPHTKLDMSVTDAIWSGPCNLSLSPVHVMFKLAYELTKGTYKYLVARKSKNQPPLFRKAVAQAYGTGMVKLFFPLGIIIILGMLFAPQVSLIFATSWSLGSGGYMLFNSGPRMYYYFCFLFAYLTFQMDSIPGLDKFSMLRERKKDTAHLTNENIAEFMAPLFTGLQARYPWLYPEKPHFGVLPSEKLKWGQAFGIVGDIGNDGTILLNPNLLKLSHDGQMAALKYFLDIQAGRGYYVATILEYFSLARIFHRIWSGFLHPRKRDALGMLMLGAIGLGAGVLGIIWCLPAAGLITAASGLTAVWGAYNYYNKKINHIITLDGPGTFHKNQLAALMARQYGYSYVNVEFMRRALAWKVLEVRREKGLDAMAALTPTRTAGIKKIIANTTIVPKFNSRTGEISMIINYRDENGIQHRDQPNMEELMQPEVKAMVKRFFAEDTLRDHFSGQVDQCLVDHAGREKNLIVVGHRRTPSFRLFENRAKKAARFYVIDHNPKEAAHPHPDAMLLDMRYLPVPEAIKLVNKALLRKGPETKTARFRGILQKKGDAWIGLAGMEDILSIKQVYGKDVARVIEQDISSRLHQILDTPFMRRLNGRKGFQDIERFGAHGRAAFLMDQKLSADTVSTALQHVRSVLAQEFEEKYVLVRPVSDWEKTMTLQQAEETAARLCKTMGDDQLVRVLQDELHGVRLLLRVNRHDLVRNYLESLPLAGKENVLQNRELRSRPGRLLHQVAEQSLGLKLEPITLQAISQPGPKRPISSPAGCGEFLPVPEIVFGVTKASFVYSEPKQRELNRKQRKQQLTSREMAEWVEASLFRARYFLRRAQVNRHKKIVIDQGKLKPIAMPQGLSAGGKDLFSSYYLKKIRALQKRYAINSEVKNADGYLLYEKTAPWALTFFGLERLVTERLGFLGRLKKFKPAVFISRAPPRHVYDKEKIRIVVVCPEITHLLDIEYKIEAPEINPCHPWVLPALLMHIEQEQLARLLVVRDLHKAAPLLLQTLEERINRCSKVPITLSAVSGNCPTKDLTREEGFSRLIQEAGITRLVHPWPEPYAAHDSGQLEAARERFRGIAGKLANDWLQKWSRKPPKTMARQPGQEESTPLMNFMERQRELDIKPQNPGPGQQADTCYPEAGSLASQEAEQRLRAGYSAYQRILHRGQGPVIAEYAFRQWKQSGGPAKYKGKYTLVTDIDGLEEDITAYFTRRMESRPGAAQIYQDFLKNIRLINIPAGEQTPAALERMAAFKGMIILSGQYQNTVRIEMNRAGKARFFTADNQEVKLKDIPGLSAYVKERREILLDQAGKTRDGAAVCWFTPSQVITHASRKLKAGSIMFINYSPEANGWKDGVDLDRLAWSAAKQGLEPDMHASVGEAAACLTDKQAAQAAVEERVRSEQRSGRLDMLKDEAEAVRRTHYRDDFYRIAVFRKGLGPIISEEALQEPFSDFRNAADCAAGRAAEFSGLKKAGIHLPGEETGAADTAIAARKKVSRLMLFVLALVMGTRALKKAGQHSLHLKLGVSQRKLPGVLLVILLMRQPAFWKAVKNILKVVNGRAWHEVPENDDMKKQWHDGRKLMARSPLFLWMMRITHTQADEIDHHLKMIIYHANKIKGTAFYLAPGRYLQEVLAADPELHADPVISSRIRERFLNQDAWLMRALGRLDNSPQNNEIITTIMRHLMKEMRHAKLAGDLAYRDHILLIFRHIDPANQQVIQFRAGREGLIKRVIPARLLQDDLLKEQLMTLYDDQIFDSNGQLHPPRRVREMSLSYAGAA